MAMQHGFKFTIKGDVFVARKSSDGGDVIAALDEADEIRERIQKMLLELPVEFTCTMPRATSRQAPGPVLAVVTEEPQDEVATAGQSTGG